MHCASTRRTTNTAHFPIMIKASRQQDTPKCLLLASSPLPASLEKSVRIQSVSVPNRHTNVTLNAWLPVNIPYGPRQRLATCFSDIFRDGPPQYLTVHQKPLQQLASRDTGSHLGTLYPARFSLWICGFSTIFSVVYPNGPGRARVMTRIYSSKPRVGS